MRCCCGFTFTVIQSGLRRISGLEAVGRTLVRLVLTEQSLTTMENLRLPNLRDLQLHHNQITHISGLEGCPRLQRLWLYDNRITTIENLEPVSGLRELWLQDNKISHISGVAHLVNLQVLNLAGNRLADLNDIHVCPCCCVPVWHRRSAPPISHCGFVPCTCARTETGKPACPAVAAILRCELW